MSQLDAGPTDVAVVPWPVRARRVAPFAALCAVVFPIAWLSDPAKPQELVASGLVFAMVGLLIVAVPWNRLAEAAKMIPVLTFCIAVFLLRDASGGGAGGFGSTLLLLPVIWQGIYGRTRALVATLVAVVVTLLVPIVFIGGSTYDPAVEWPRAIVALLMWSVVGFVVHSLVVALRSKEASLAELVEQLDGQANTDALTGLANRRAWNDRLDLAVATAGRGGASVTIALLDIDHFKAYNDRHGHPAGDDLLSSLGAAWRASSRSIDLLCRWGGEEFAVLLVNADPAAARVVVERLRALVPYDQTFSCGMATWEPPMTPTDLMEAADRALYTAKADGRDRIVEATTGQQAPDSV